MDRFECKWWEQFCFPSPLASYEGAFGSKYIMEKPCEGMSYGRRIVIKKMKRRFFWFLCLCLLGPMIWTGRPAKAETEKTEILIGAHLPLSGVGSLVGAEQKWAYDKAVDDINKAGGIYVKQYGKKLPVHLVVIDDESDPIKAADAVEQLITQTKVDLLLSGQVGVMGVIPGMITAEKYKKYYHGSVIWVPDFLEHNLKWCTMYFITIESAAIMPFEVWGSLPEEQRPRKPALFMEDSTDGRQMGDGLEATAEKYGYEIALRVKMPMGGNDFSSQILKAKSMGVDAIILMANVPETVTLVRQMKKMNFSVKFFHGMKGTWATEFYEALGKDAEYIFCDGFWSEDYPFAEAKKLGECYYKEIGKHSVSVGMYYALCQVLWQAIEKVGTLDSAKVRQAVLDNQFDTVNGKVDYDERGVALFPLAQLQWWNRRQQVVYPFEYSKLKVKVAPPWDERKKKEILIGTHLPLSGAGAMVAIEQKWAYEQAVKDINKAGGIYVRQYGKKLPVRLVVMDDETDPVKAAAVVEQLITQKKVDALLSGFTGAYAVLPGMITAEKYQKYYHGSVIWVPDFLKHNFQWSTMYFFDMAQGGAISFEVMNSLPEEQRPKRPAIFVEDTTDGKQIGEMWTALAEKYGYKIALLESMGAMGIGTKDFSEQIIKAKSMGVDTIILLANTEEAVTLVRQMKKLNFSVKFFHGMKGTWATEFYEALGKDAQYVFCDGFWSGDYPFKGAKELGARYYKEFGKHSVSAGMYYALCQTLWQAIEKAGTLDSAKVRQVVLDNQFDTVNGKVDYDERGIALFPLADLQWWKGKQQVIYPFEYSKSKVKIAPPWNKREGIRILTSPK